MTTYSASISNPSTLSVFATLKAQLLYKKSREEISWMTTSPFVYLGTIWEWLSTENKAEVGCVCGYKALWISESIPLVEFVLHSVSLDPTIQEWGFCFLIKVGPLLLGFWHTTTQNGPPKVYQPWIFTGRTDAKAEAPILLPPDTKSQLIGKDPDAGKEWWQEEKGMTGDEMVGGHNWLNGHEFEQTHGDGEGQGSLACCSPWGCKESDTS